MAEAFAPLPLAGVRVVDFSTLLPGPLATLMLVEAGAEVIKIERPGGEDARRMPPFVDGKSAFFGALNARKSVRVLDMRVAADVEAARDLVRSADVVVEQFRPGVMDRLGLGYHVARALNPKIIYCAITGYGQTGPNALKAGHDLGYQAEAGMLGALAEPGLPAPLVADIGGGALPAVINILLALRQRELTGEGAFLDIGMAPFARAFVPHLIADQASDAPSPAGGFLLTGASPRYQIYRAADGRAIAVAALEEKFWRAFCGVLGLDPATLDDAGDPEGVKALVASRLATKTAADWEPLFVAADCCVELVQPPEALAPGEEAVWVADAGGRRVPMAPVPIVPALRHPRPAGDLPWPELPEA